MGSCRSRSNGRDRAQCRINARTHKLFLLEEQLPFTSGMSLMGVDTYEISKLEEPNLDAMFYFLGFIVSLLAGTIGFLYKEASHTSYIWFEWPPRARDSPCPDSGKSQSRPRPSPPRPWHPARRTPTRAA